MKTRTHFYTAKNTKTTKLRNSRRLSAESLSDECYFLEAST